MLLIELSKDELQKLICDSITSCGIANKTTEDELLTREKTASYLEVSLPTLNAWEKQGQLKPVRYGSRVYYRRSDLIGKTGKEERYDHR